MANVQIHPRVQKAYRAMRQAAVHHPEFLLPFAKIKHLMRADDNGVPTAAVDTAGRITLGPTTDDLTLQQTAGRVCHELMHLAMAHFARQGQRDAQRWNIAGDMLINCALRDSGLEHPSTWIFLPDEYTGEKTTEAVYAWLATDEGKEHCQGADGSNGCGCGVDKAGGKDADGSEPVVIDGPQLAADLVALSKVMGASGRSPIMDLLRPSAPRQNWQSVLKYGVQRAVGGSVRDVRTYARLSRRPMVGITRPGLVSQACNVAVIIDCSTSVDRKWLAQIAAECENVVSVTAGVGIFLATHTAGLEWSGWVKKGSGAGASIAKAVAFTGGTNASEAYAAVSKAGRFDVVIHFTDGEIGRWPAVPAKAKLIVGLVGHGNYMSKVPAGTLVIPIAS